MLRVPLATNNADESCLTNMLNADDSRGVLSGGTGEASQETLQRHFQKVMGLSPIQKMESEAISQFTMALHQQQTEQQSLNSNSLPPNQASGREIVTQPSSRLNKQSRLSDRRTRQHQIESFRSNASGGIMTHISSQMDTPSTSNKREANQFYQAQQESVVILEEALQKSDKRMFIESQPIFEEKAQDSSLVSPNGSGELQTLQGFYKAQTHEKTSDLTMVDKISYEKRNVNVLVEDELDEFRQEIEVKFAEAETKRYVMAQKVEQKKQRNKQKSSTRQNLDLQDLGIGQTVSQCSRITLDELAESLESDGSDQYLGQKQSPRQAAHMSQQSLVVLNNPQHLPESSSSSQQSLDGDQLDFQNGVAMTPGELSKVDSQGATSRRIKNASLTSPVSIEMPMSELQSDEQDLNIPSSHQRHNQISRTSPQSITYCDKVTQPDQQKKKKKSQLRKFAQQIFQRHITQAQTDQKNPQQEELGSALSKLLEGLVKQQKRNGVSTTTLNKPSSSQIAAKVRRVQPGAVKPQQQQRVNHHTNHNAAKRMVTHKRSTNNCTTTRNSILSSKEGGDVNLNSTNVRSKSNPRQSLNFTDAKQQQSAEVQEKGKRKGFCTLQDSKNNNLISIAQKRRRAGIATRQERSFHSNSRRQDSIEKARSVSRRSAQRQSNALKSALGHQLMHSPATKQSKRESSCLNSGGPDKRDQFLVSNILTKSLGVPMSGSLNMKDASKNQQDGLFKIFKDFEQKMESGFQPDNLNRSVSIKRGRYSNADKTKQGHGKAIKQKNVNDDQSRASSVPRSNYQKHSMRQQSKSISRAKKGYNCDDRDSNNNAQQSYARKKANSQISPVSSVKAHTRYLKKSEIKQLSTCSESMLVYEIVKPQGKQVPLTVKNQSSFQTQTTANGSKTHGSQVSNIRVKTPNEGTLNGSKNINQNSGSGNRANLLNKYLRASDLQHHKKSVQQRVASSRSKRTESTAGNKIVKRQSTRTAGDSLGSFRNSSLTSQKLVQNGSQSLANGSMQIISGSGFCKNSSRSKSGRGAKVNNNPSSVNQATGNIDTMKVYQTYIGQTAVRLSGYNRRSQLSRQGGSSVDHPLKEEVKQHLLSFQHPSVSSSMTNQTKKQGFKDIQNDFPLTATANQSQVKTPSANLLMHGLSNNSTCKIDKVLQGQMSQSSYKKLLDSSMNYPQSTGLLTTFAVDCKRSIQGHQQALAFRGADQATSQTKINILNRVKVNRQSNTSLGLGPNAAGLIIGNNTVKILKPNLSQQKLGNNSLQKASSFENQFTLKQSARIPNQSQQQTGAPRNNKSSEKMIARSDQMSKVQGGLNQPNKCNEMIAKHSQKLLYQQILNQNLQGTTSSLSHPQQQSQQKSQQQQCTSTDLNMLQLKLLSSQNCSKAIPTTAQGIQQALQLKQAQTTKHNKQVITAYQSNATALSTLNLSRPMQMKMQGFSSGNSFRHEPLSTNQSSIKKQKSASKMGNSQRSNNVLRSSQSIGKHSAKSTMLSNRSKRGGATTSHQAAPTATDIFLSATQSTTTQPAPPQTNSTAFKGGQLIKRALSKSRQMAAANFPSDTKNNNCNNLQQSSAVLLDIDKLVKTSAAAALVKQQSTKNDFVMHGYPSSNGNVHTDNKLLSGISRNNLPISTCNSGKIGQCVPLLNKKKTLTSANSNFNPNATEMSMKKQNEQFQQTMTSQILINSAHNIKKGQR